MTRAGPFRPRPPQGPPRGPTRVLVVAGLDPTGRAGLLADLSVLEANGSRAAALVTALTAQGAGFSFAPTAVSLLRAQLQGLISTGPVHAVKIGMVANARQLRFLCAALPADVPWVMDPVVLSSNGEPLSTLAPKNFQAAASPNVVFTPNLDEARWLTGAPRGKAEALGAALLGWGFGAVLIKSAKPASAGDLLVDATGAELLLGALRTRSSHHRGTGCRLASAIAAAMASGVPLRLSVVRGKEVVARYLQTV